MVKAKDVFEEISKYDINSKTVRDLFFSSNISDSAHFYYNNMILQYLKTTDDLFGLYLLYNKQEMGSIINRPVTINENGEKKEVSESELLYRRKKRI